MNGQNQQNHSFIYTLTIYVIGFLLFCEWLLPLETITNTDDVTIFFIYAAFCFFVSFLQIQWWISMPLKLVGLIFIIDGLYIGERLFSRDWFSVVYDQLMFNIQVIQTQEWWQMTPLFRSVLFLVLLWLMSYLLFYWLVVAKRMLIFVVMTFIYVTVIDTFTIYDGKWAIVRTFILAMAALGLSSFAKEMDRESIPSSSFKRVHLWVIPLVGIILFSTVAAYASPKLSPQWPDPVPYLKSATGGSGPGGVGNVVQKVGYGENDSRLGGSFVQDNTPVFEAMADGDRYWRIESKDTYTGKGWEDTLSRPTTTVSASELEYPTFTDNVESEEQKAMIRMERGATFEKLVYPYGLSSLEATPENSRYNLHTETGEIDTLRGGSLAKINEFVVNYDYPSFEYGQLRQTGDNDPAEIREKYLQLPETLPSRVRNLASQIVEGEDNRYDKAKAVEQYFSSNGFEYSTTEVPVPSENQDYVDQFLFETQLGYCDNYSTSMVVLLRSEGIPARWVKGFTSGERIDSETPDYTDDVQNTYQVTSANAHSWVEVYFAGIGWVPFEPTQGFSNNTDFYSDVDTSTDDTETDEGAQTPEDNMGNPQQLEEETSSSDANAGGTSSFNFTWIYVGAGILAVSSLILYFTRFRWMSTMLIRRFKKEGNAENYERAYHFLLKLLAHKGFKRNPEQTLREYARSIDSHYQTNEMRQLTHHYERFVYRNDEHNVQWGKVSELWENLIKKALS
ncbi:DUF3488 and transglutaminase-like domain-containing protein [Halobacillus litoralis]|uniref:transglutaminase TgpA family protein n=1 Tax=Halobacillus litoralis TaxID=45668 RepID=UPI001CD802FD|nr:transglutaminase domain-containing protein [Halobacillus litoralis]MCA0970597.1 DUF3488 and transglutaminase-like domain-containing protein [Halobacillus litoralis]